jgi:hypothetical protein
MDTDEPSRGDRLIEELKARPRPGQFRLISLFGLMLFFAVVFAIPRLVGVTYERYFMFFYGILFGLAPLAAWGLTAVLPCRFGAFRFLISAAAAVAIVAPVCVLSVLDPGSPRQMIGFWAGILLLLWLPQIGCITAVWYFVFRQTSWPQRRRP